MGWLAGSGNYGIIFPRGHLLMPKEEGMLGRESVTSGWEWGYVASKTQV
jgi:hypothetical protein